MSEQPNRHENPVRVGNLEIRFDAQRNHVTVLEHGEDSPTPGVWPFEVVVIRNHLEAETLARVLALHFGSGTFDVIRRHRRSV